MVEFHVLQGDCLELFPGVRDNSIDLIVTSPPYNCRKEYGGTFQDEMSWPDYYTWMEQVISECYRVLVRGGVLALNVPGVIRWQAEHKYSSSWAGFDPEYETRRNGEKVIGKARIEPLGFRLFEIMQRNDSHMREPIIWVKGSEDNAICSDYRMGSDSDPYMRPCHEMILLGSKDQWFHRGGTGRRGSKAVPSLDDTKDVWFVPAKRSQAHPAVFPIEIPHRLIRLFTHAPEACVLDPFCGMGTTGVAAVSLGRRFIGFEQNPAFCSEAQENVGKFSNQLDFEK